MLFNFVDVLKPLEKPFIDIRHLLDLLDRIPKVKRVCDCEDPFVGRVVKLLVNIFDVVILKPVESSRASNAPLTYLGKTKELVIDGSNRFLNGLLESSSDAHHLSNALHATTKMWTDTIELFEIPAWNFNDDIIQTGLEACTGHSGDRIFDLIQGHSKTKFCGNEC